MSSQSAMVGRGCPIILSKLPCFEFSFGLKYEYLASFQMILKRRQRARERAKSREL